MPTNLNPFVDTSEIAADAVTTSEIDQSITPSWTGKHSFGSGLSVATGQAIEDDSANNRFGLLNDRTIINDNVGDAAFASIHNNGTNIFAESGQPVQIRDNEGVFTAVQYSTSASAPGTLSLDNAVLNPRGNGTVAGTGGSSVEVGANSSTQSTKIGMVNGNGAGAYVYNISGEVNVQDDSGNVTTIS